MNQNEFLCKYYEDHDEDIRLKKDLAHQVEFIVTNTYIEKYLKTGDKILDIGAGTGAYSLFYAAKGYNVEALELVPHNIDVFKSHIKKGMNVNVVEGTSLNLSGYKDNTFDVTLLFGPLYHLYTEEDKEKTISEALRVTKTGGKIFIAYLTHDSMVISYFVEKGNILKMPEVCDDKFRFIDKPEEIFSSFHIKEFKKLMSKFDCKLLHSVATDGLSRPMREYINGFTQEQFELWIKYMLGVCERKDLQGYSNHMLYICEKN
jgi:ubiquinone/menaquinone biosynthesis C-methylase UbiE